MSYATGDPTLESLVPRGSPLRSGALVGLALALLVAAWFLPPLLQPGLFGSSGGGSSIVVGPQRVVSTAMLQPHGLGGVRVTRVDPVPGAHVVDAWVVEGDRSAPSDPTPASDEVLAALGAGPTTHLPRAVRSGGTATLVVLWHVDDCAALVDDGPTVHVASGWVTRAEQIPWSPFGESGLCGA